MLHAVRPSVLTRTSSPWVFRDDEGMQATSRMRIWLALAVVAGIAAVSATFWIGRGQKSIPVTDLARLETSVDPSLSPVHAALAWTFEIIGGRRVLTDTDLDRRLAEGYRSGDTAAELQAGFDHMREELTGPVGLVRIDEIDDTRATGVGLGAKGMVVLVDVAVDQQGRISLWQITEPPSQPRVPPWQTGLIITAGWAFVGAGMLARRSGRGRTVTGLSTGAVVVFSQVLVLSDTPTLYLIGRFAPALVLPYGAMAARGHVPRARSAVAAHRRRPRCRRGSVGCPIGGSGSGGSPRHSRGRRLARSVPGDAGVDGGVDSGDDGCPHGTGVASTPRLAIAR